MFIVNWFNKIYLVADALLLNETGESDHYDSRETSSVIRNPGESNPSPGLKYKEGYQRSSTVI